VNGDGSQWNDAGSSPLADDSAADVVEQGSRRFFPSLNWPSMKWRPPRGAAILLAAGVVIGLAAGYATGYRQAPRNASAPPTPSSGPASTAFTDGLALTQDTGTCSVQSGRELQLGVQVTNQSARPIGLGGFRTVLPLSGLKVVSQQWGPCGAIGAAQVPDTLGPGESTWLSVTVKVLVACPAPIPVQFAVGYTYAGEAATADLPGFPDLGQVPYTGCPES
jgi:hypothetical protein